MFRYDPARDPDMILNEVLQCPIPALMCSTFC